MAAGDNSTSLGRHVFVGGLHRSGTTPLARALASHPEISGLEGTGVPEDEGQHLQDEYARIRVHGGMGRFALSERAHLLESDASSQTGENLMASWSPYWDTSRRLLLEKSPANLIMGRYLQAAFPGSAFVVVVRHPVVVALALQKWNPLIVARNGRRRASLTTMLANWVRAQRLLLEDAPRLHRLHVLRYEDLVADPAAQLEPIARLLELSSPIDASSIRGGHNRAYAETWRALGEGHALRRRRRDTLVDRFEPELAAWGYTMSDPSVIAPWHWSDATSPENRERRP